MIYPSYDRSFSNLPAFLCTMLSRAVCSDRDGARELVEEVAVEMKVAMEMKVAVLGSARTKVKQSR